MTDARRYTPLERACQGYLLQTDIQKVSYVLYSECDCGGLVRKFFVRELRVPMINFTNLRDGGSRSDDHG